MSKPIFRWGSLAAAIATLSACATPAPSGATNSSNSVSAKDATQAFVDAVYLYCVPSIEQGKPLDELSVTDASPIERVAKGESILGRQVGDTPSWRMAGGNVKNENTIGERCQISTFGVPVRGAYDIIGLAITQPSIGYHKEGDLSEPPYLFRYLYTKDLEGYRYSVSLSGNEPGAPGTMSRFSTVLATVYKAEITPDTEKK